MSDSFKLLESIQSNINEKINKDNIEINKARNKKNESEKSLVENSYPEYEKIVSIINSSISSLEDKDDIQELLQNIIGICRDIADDRGILVESELKESNLGHDDAAEALMQLYNIYKQDDNEEQYWYELADIVNIDTLENWFNQY